jgi:hypothetical protein
MKSLQNKLNLIKEGKGNKELFLKEARAMFPNIVTGALTFDQAIHNLTERGILSEGFVGIGNQSVEQPNWFKVFNENIKADLKKPDAEVEKMEVKGYDYKDHTNSNNISTESILTGYYTEMKDPKNAEKTEEELKKIVVKNLEKDPMHYVKDGQFGVKGLGYTDKHPGLGHTKEVTGKYKSSGMEPVKLNESKHSAEADLKIHKSELNMLNKIKPTGEKQLKRKAELEKKIADLEKKMTEVFYGSSDGDFDANQEDIQMAYSYYDKGLEAYSEGDFLKADRYYTAALKYGSYVGFTGADLPPYGTEHLEEASNSTPNELASYIGILQNQINAEKDPKKLKMLKQDLEDTKQELAKRREAKKTKNGMSEYLGGRLEVPRNYGMDFDDEEDDYEDEDEEYYDEEGNVVPLRSPLHPRNRNMGEGNKKLKESYGMSLEDAMREAYKESLNGYVQHVEDTGDGVFFEVSDWYDSEATVVSFEDGRKFNDKTSEYIMNEADSIKKRRAILPSKQKGIADEIPVVSMLSKVIQQAWAEPDLNKAKEMVLTHIQQSRIHPRSKKTMSYNIETAQTKPRLDQYLANALLSYEKMSVTEGANKVMEKAIKEIEKKSELAKAEAKLHQVEELISELENKLTMTEADGMSDMVDKKKVKEIKRNLKFLENKKKRYLSEKAKLDKKYGVKTMIEEEKVDPTIEDEKMAGKAMQSMRRDVAQPARAWSEIVKGILASKGVKK